MDYQAELTYPTHTLDYKGQLLALLLVLSILVQLIQPLLVLNMPAFPAGATATKPAAIPTPVPDAAPLPLPSELVGKPEVPVLRTLDSATFDLGNGHFARYQANEPLHYQANDGTWQRINPAYQQIGGRWINSANRVRTALEAHNSAATINAADLAIHWQPQALLAVSADGASHAIGTAGGMATATVAPTADTIRYAAGWQSHSQQWLPWANTVSNDLADQWQSRPGAAEYTMRLAQLPALPWWQQTPSYLDLQVQLTLEPGTTLKVNDAAVNFSDPTPLVTQSALIFVDPTGEELILQPPVTYEQNDRTNQIAASYIVVPTQHATRNTQHADAADLRNSFNLRIRTPWSWLAAAERHFPVIIDPIFQMRRPWLAAEAIYTPSTPGAPYTFDQMHYTADQLYLGRNTANAYRAALRFDLPVMPPGTQIDRAWLHVVPSDYKRVNNTFKVSLEGLIGQMDLYAIQNDLWLNGGEPAVNLNEPLQPASQIMGYSAGKATQTGVQWDVTNLAQSWLPLYGGLPATNNGLLLRLKNEFCDPNGVIFLPETLFCGGFRFDLANDAWALHPDLENTQVNGTPDDPQLKTSETGGIRLVVFYHIDNTLLESNPLTYAMPGNQLPQGADKNPPYYYAEHLHNVAKPPAEWQAVVARSQGQPQGIFPPVEPGVNNSYRQPLNGAMTLDLRSSNDSFTVAKASATTDQVSYLLLNGRGNESPLFQQQLPLRTAFSPAATGALSNVIGYDIRLIGETGTINAPLNVKQTVNYTFDSADPLALWNLQLPTGSNAAVRITLTGDGTRPESYLQAYGKNFEAKIVRSGSQGEVRTSAFDDKTAGPKAWALHPTMATSADLDNVQAGQYALAVRYNGPQLTVRDVEECGAEFCDTKIIPVKYTMTVEVLACPVGSFPTNSGQCQKVFCPSTASLAANYRETNDYGVWSNSGWTGVNESAPIASVVGDTAPLLGPRRVSGIFRAMTVAAIGGKITYDKSTGAITVSSDVNNEAFPAKVRLIQCPAPGNSNPAFTSSFPVFDGKMSHPHALLGAGLRAEPLGSGQIKADPWPLTDRQGSDLEQESFVVTPASNAAPTASMASGSARLRRVVGPGPVLNLRFQTGWSFSAVGWPSVSSTVTATPNNPTPPDLASLLLTLGNQLELDTSAADGPTARLFLGVRAKAGTITQPAVLGGASKTVQMVILPRGVAMPQVDVLCPPVVWICAAPTMWRMASWTGPGRCPMCTPTLTRRRC